jgi:hypothetical protein
MSKSKQLFGKYRGTVVDNVDPLFLGRITALVPDVSNLVPSTWAMPCVPIAGKLNGTYVVPQIGAGVWIEYEHGDPDYPIWVGGYWGVAAEVPPLALLAPPGDPPVVINTTLQNAVVVSDVPVVPMVEGGVMLSSGASYITISPTMVQIVSPTILINGLTIVNDGALAVALG